MILMLLPGGKEKDIHFHRLTQVLVDDLQKCWTGVKFGTEPVPRRLALLVFCSDGPANRKAMGIVSHSGHMMCPTCLLPCPWDAEHKRSDCSDCSEHPHRTLEGTRPVRRPREPTRTNPGRLWVRFWADSGGGSFDIRGRVFVALSVPNRGGLIRGRIRADSGGPIWARIGACSTPVLGCNDACKQVPPAYPLARSTCCLIDGCLNVVI
jgi:hypothetical protein